MLFENSIIADQSVPSQVLKVKYYYSIERIKLSPLRFNLLKKGASFLRLNRLGLLADRDTVPFGIVSGQPGTCTAPLFLRRTVCAPHTARPGNPAPSVRSQTRIKFRIQRLTTALKTCSVSIVLVK